jgi:RNA polymerase sigma-70 factor, ECF subfamily
MPQDRLAPPPGDAEDFREIFDQFFPRLRSFFLAGGFPAADAEDLSQTALWNVYRSRGELRSEGSLASWIYSIARNLARDEWRKRGRQGVMESVPETVESPEPSAAEVAEQRDELERTRRALALLPHGMRTCLLLQVQQGLAYQEIADRLGLALPTVKVQIWNARKRLRSSLE